MAVADAQQPQGTQPHPRVRLIIRAAQTGAVIQGAQTATAAPVQAVTALPRAAGKIVAAPVHLRVQAWRYQILLRALATLFRRVHLDWATKFEKQLRAKYPTLDNATVRRIVEREMQIARVFERRSLARAERDLTAASGLPTEALRKERARQVMARERYWLGLHEKALLARANGACQAEVVRQRSPLGARWVMTSRSGVKHTAACRALNGAVLPWSVIDIVGAPPGPHVGCSCRLAELGPGDVVPDAGAALSFARGALALDEAIQAVADPGEVDAFLAGERVRPVIARALLQLTHDVRYDAGMAEAAYVENLHPRGRGGEWTHALWFTPGMHNRDPEADNVQVGYGKQEAWGRGVWHEPSQTLHTWPEEEGTHGAVIHAKGMEMADALPLRVSPEGELTTFPENEDELTRALPKILAADPRLSVKVRAKSLREADYVENLHPRGRGGEWIHKLNFTPGKVDEWGRGLVAPDGTVHTWSEEARKAPDHKQMEHRLGIPEDKKRHFRISPRGRATFSSTTPEPLQQHVLDVTGLTSGNYREETQHVQAVSTGGSDLFHVAPTAERQRIHQYGLQVADPFQSPEWLADSERTNEMKQLMPPGVYAWPDAQSASDYAQRLQDTRGSPQDVWRIPAEQTSDVRPDPASGSILGTKLIPHAVPIPVLHEGPEHRESGWQPEPHVQAVSTDYRGEHTAPSSSYGSPMHDMTRTRPADFYNKGTQLQFFGSGDDKPDKESLAVINAVRNKPDAMVTVHRAVPAGVTDINSGDWVTPSRAYAEAHAARTDGARVISKQVPARTLWTTGDELNEFGYQAAPHVQAVRTDANLTTGDNHDRSRETESGSPAGGSAARKVWLSEDGNVGVVVTPGATAAPGGYAQTWDEAERRVLAVVSQRGAYIARLRGIAADAHAGQHDKSGVPYIKHLEAVADSVSDRAKPIALLHDAIEDRKMTPEQVKAALTEPHVTTPEQAQTMLDAVLLLTRDRNDSYERYVEKIKAAPGKAGELAREVKRADLSHNLGRLTPEIIAAKPDLPLRYDTALKTLREARYDEPLHPRGRGGRWIRKFGLPQQHSRQPHVQAVTAEPSTYWHITSDPNFKIDPKRVPTEMGGAADQQPDAGLMVTKDLPYWASMLQSHPDELGVEYENGDARGYAAEIDLSKVPADEHWLVNRGNSDERWVNRPDLARVKRVVPLRQAFAIQDARDQAINQSSSGHVQAVTAAKALAEPGAKVRITGGYWMGQKATIINTPETAPEGDYVSAGLLHVRTADGAEGIIKDTEWTPEAETFRGKGPDAQALGDLPVPVGDSSTATRGKLESIRTPEEMRGYGDAIRAGVARHPEILSSPQGLQSVSFISASRWDSLRSGAASEMILGTVTSRGRPGADIVINDLIRIHPDGVKRNLAPADGTSEGVMVHEVGHVFAETHGAPSIRPELIKAMLTKHGLGPAEAATISRYAAADPREFFAEAYSQQYTPGFQIEDPEVRRKFLAMVQDMRQDPVIQEALDAL